MLPSDVRVAFLQDFILAFMMGTHSRLGAHSHVLLLDTDMALKLVKSLAADKW